MSFPVDCPKCKKTAFEQLQGVKSYYDPHFKCRFCSYNGPLYVVNRNPEPELKLAEPTNLFEYFLQKHLN